MFCLMSWIIMLLGYLVFEKLFDFFNCGFLVRINDFCVLDILIVGKGLNWLIIYIDLVGGFW